MGRETPSLGTGLREEQVPILGGKTGLPRGSGTSESVDTPRGPKGPG